MIRTASSQRLRLALQRGAASLDSSASRSVCDFVMGQFNPDGGFRGRSIESDLYYAVFGLECARALDLELPAPAVAGFLRRCAQAEIDFVHLTCLIRCAEILGWGAGLDAMVRWKERLAAHVCKEGGFHRSPGRLSGSIYDSFLGMLAWEAFAEPLPDGRKMVDCLGRLRKRSGGFVNDDGLGTPTTPVTAAALVLHAELGCPEPPGSREWMLSRLCPKGGFRAAALVPVPDLLSTATALHAARTQGWIHCVPADRCLEFVESLWDESGGFGGHALDRRPDCEYTFYGLLALGSLVAGSTP